ncbi:MAG: membrane protein insertion efficiency factor YidD [Parcubacteria group bacterium]|nr:membrane protein insertion efficiency factor YidD [Parcubacteria group bacterium]
MRTADMNASIVLRSPSNILIIAVIRFYQKWISPYKGFRCAHNMLHAQGGCSSFGLKVFGTHPFREALRLLRGRFAECKEANQILRSSEREKKRRGSWASEGADGIFDSCCDGPGDCSFD